MLIARAVSSTATILLFLIEALLPLTEMACLHDVNTQSESVNLSPVALTLKPRATTPVGEGLVSSKAIPLIEQSLPDIVKTVRIEESSDLIIMDWPGTAA
jgi:hypothetical protein